MSQSNSVDLYSAYGNFLDAVLRLVRSETFGEDFGQNSWLTADEYEKFLGWLALKAEAQVLDVACGSGGPALFLTQQVGCYVVGIDNNEQAVNTAEQMALQMCLDAFVRFQYADANSPLPFADSSFDSIICVDAINHLADRLQFLKECHRILKPGGRVLYTDPVIISGAVSSAELATRSSIGFFLFMPPGENERFIQKAGLTLLQQEDVTGNVASVAGRWHDARQKHCDDLIKVEGRERFDGLQKFFAVVHKLAAEKRLSRFVFLAHK